MNIRRAIFFKKILTQQNLFTNGLLLILWISWWCSGLPCSCSIHIC